MRSYTIKNRTKFCIKLVVFILIVTGALVFLVSRKEALARQCVDWLENTLSQSSQMDVKIRKVSGSLLGSISFQDVLVSEIGAEPEEAPVLRIKEFQFRFRFLDFISKKFDSKMVVVVREPEVRWSPHLGLRSPNFPFFGWMREWAMSQKNNFVVKIENMALLFEGLKPVTFSGINARVDGSSFHLELPMSHVPVGPSDVTTVFVAEGKFDMGPQAAQDLLVGQIRTEGTVVDWRPLSQESSFNFVFSQEYFKISSMSFAGDVRFEASIDFMNDFDLAMSIQAKDVPIHELEFFMKLDKSIASAEHFDLEANFQGNIFAPQMDARARIYNGFIGTRSFKAMDINAEGVYPTVRLNNSRILLDDGSTMLFADKALELGDLWRGSTFEMLISESEQDTVVWGNWEFSRPRDSDDKPEFFMQRMLGNNARVHFRKMNQDQESFQDHDNKDMEVGLEFKLRSKDSLKVEYRDDQEVVGVLERKLIF